MAVQKIQTVAHLKIVMTAFVKLRATLVRVPIHSIPHAQIIISILGIMHEMQDTFVNVLHLHAVAVTNAKQLIPGLRMFQTIPIPVYAKYYRQKLVQRTKIVRRKRNVVTDTVSSATPVQKTAIALLQNGAAKTDIVS